MAKRARLRGAVFFFLSIFGLAAQAGGPNTALATNRSTLLSVDGRWVLCARAPANLVPGALDYNGGNDVFLYDRVNELSILVSCSAAASAVTASGSSRAGLGE